MFVAVFVPLIHSFLLLRILRIVLLEVIEAAP
jgi:hypothetical protein